MERGNKHEKIPFSTIVASSSKYKYRNISYHKIGRSNTSKNKKKYLKSNLNVVYSLFDSQSRRIVFHKRYRQLLTMFSLIWGFVQALFRDLIGFLYYFKFQVQFRKIVFFQECIINKFDSITKRFKQKTAIIYQDEEITFEELQKQTYRIANWLEQTMNIGLNQEFYNKINDSKYVPELTQIGLILGNIPEMPAFLLGIARVRASSVLFNYNQKKDTLLNAFRATKCRIVIYEKRYLDSLREISDQLDKDIRFFMYDRDSLHSDNENVINNNISSTNISSLDDKSPNFYYHGVTSSQLSSSQVNFAKILQHYDALPPKKVYKYSIHDYIGYIFTSGTTGGNIKATPIDNIRFIVGFLSQTNAFGINEKDNIYIPLPLFHTFPCIVGLGRCILGGSTITIADKFSASKFWLDCVRYDCTVAFYIGETCRYLLAQPFRPEEAQHRLRMMCGLGMRKEIWKEFTERFNIKKVAEFYGSSEGNINLFNMCNVEGSCGFIPYYFGPLQRYLFPIYLILFDPITNEPIRAKNGLCQIAKPGQIGLIIGQIKDNLPYTKFLGYTAGDAENSKKILTNILNFGDYAFSSGDLMEMDIYGNLYFRDRTGDTFRYKGENVSTTEIEEIATKFFPKNTAFVCYGIEIPKCEGRIGMLAIEKPQIGSYDLDGLYQHLKARLPDYAIPKFIRITDKIETTSTHKFVKYHLREAGYTKNDSFINDDVFYFDKLSQKYVNLKPGDEDQFSTFF